MPVFSCGGMRYQHKWRDHPLSEVPADNQANLEATIRRAMELGICHVETARGYGSSERQLGVILPRLPRDELIVQTKICPHVDPKQFVKQFEESLQRLQLPSVDLLSLHGVNDRDTLHWAIRKGGCFEAAQELRKQGKVRFVGFSSHAPLDIIQQAIRFGEPETGRGFDYVNLHWYFIFQRNWPAIVEAAERDMGVFIISPSDKGGKLYEPPDKLVQLCDPLSPMVFNDLFCLSRPEVHTLSIGAARPTDFDEHLKTLPLLAEANQHLRPIEDRLGEAMRAAVGDASPETITEGIPNSLDCPRKLNFQVMLWLYNLARGWDLKEYAKMRFNMLGNSSHWFPGGAPAELAEVPRQTVLDAVQASPRAEAIPDLLSASVTLLGGESVQRLSKSE